MCDDLDEVLSKVENMSLTYSINVNLLKYLNSIINEIINKDTFELDVYEICVECGSDLTWDIDYNINELDLIWLKNEGFEHFINTINSAKTIKTKKDHENLVSCYKQLYGLFELSIINY